MSIDPATYKILIVDDEFIQRKVNRLWLETCDFVKFEVHEAANTTDAEIFIRTEHPACIILDYLIDDEDGFVFLHKMKKYADCPPIIFQTAAYDPQLRKKCLALGASAFFDKLHIDCEEFCLTVLTLARLQNARQLQHIVTVHNTAHCQFTT